jgi:hypothetical protein
MAKRELSIEQIASEVGRVFGTTEAHARKWLNQRQELMNALSQVRDKAAGLISELGEGVVRNGWRRRKAVEGIPVVQPGMRESRKKRVLSAQTRAKMRAAARRRWAEIKKKTAK